MGRSWGEEQGGVGRWGGRWPSNDQGAGSKLEAGDAAGQPEGDELEGEGRSEHGPSVDGSNGVSDQFGDDYKFEASHPVLDNFWSLSPGLCLT